MCENRSGWRGAARFFARSSLVLVKRCILLADVLLDARAITGSIVREADPTTYFQVDVGRDGIAWTKDERGDQRLSEHRRTGKHACRERSGLLVAGHQRRKLANRVEPLEKAVAGLGLYLNGRALYLAQRVVEGHLAIVGLAGGQQEQVERANGLPAAIRDDLVFDGFGRAIDAGPGPMLRPKLWIDVRRRFRVPAVAGSGRWVGDAGACIVAGWIGEEHGGINALLLCGVAGRKGKSNCSWHDSYSEKEPQCASSDTAQQDAGKCRWAQPSLLLFVREKCMHRIVPFCCCSACLPGVVPATVAQVCGANRQSEFAGSIRGYSCTLFVVPVCKALSGWRCLVRQETARWCCKTQ